MFHPDDLDKYRSLLFALCLKFVHNADTAEDLVQDTLLSAFVNLEHFVGDDIKPWLARIAANKCKDYLKSAAVRHASPSDIDEVPEEPDSDPLPEDYFEDREGLRIICDAVENLPDTYSEIIRLNLLFNESPQTIAARLQLPPATVYTRIARGRKILQKTLKGAYPEYAKKTHSN